PSPAFFLFNHTAPTALHTLSLHDALPIWFTHARLACGCRIAFREGVEGSPVLVVVDQKSPACTLPTHVRDLPLFDYREALRPPTDRKSTRLNSSHQIISYAVFCLKKKN